MSVPITKVKANIEKFTVVVIAKARSQNEKIQTLKAIYRLASIGLELYGLGLKDCLLSVIVFNTKEFK